MRCSVNLMFATDNVNPRIDTSRNQILKSIVAGAVCIIRRSFVTSGSHYCIIYSFYLDSNIMHVHYYSMGTLHVFVSLLSEKLLLLLFIII